MEEEDNHQEEFESPEKEYYLSKFTRWAIVILRI